MAESHSESHARTVSLHSKQWSCSELSKGAEMCANLAGLDLAVDPTKLKRSELIQAIKDPIVSNNMSRVRV